MKALMIDAPDGAPYVAEVADPVPAAGLQVYSVAAAALTNLDMAVAQGRHYLSADRWPHGIGREAIVTSSAGDRYFLNAMATAGPWGTMAERVLADGHCALSVPDGIPDHLAAALGNAGLAGWLSLSWRGALQRGESVLVIGATGASGRIAVAAASLLGAGRIVAAGRDSAALDALLGAGADGVVRLDADGDLAASFDAASNGGFDIVIDFLNGAPAQAALHALRRHGRMVQIGSALAPGIHLDAQIARRNSIDVRGFAYYHAPIEAQIHAYRDLCRACNAGDIGIAHEVVALDDAARAWVEQKSGRRTRWVVMP